MSDARRPGSATGAQPRAATARALVEVIDRGHTLTDALAGIELLLGDGRDRALVRRLCNRSLCDLPALEWRLARLLRQPLPRKARSVHFLLLAALGELIEGREPAPAVIHASVDATRVLKQPHLARLVNGVLRGWQRDGQRIESALPQTPAMQLGYPDWMVERLRRDWPEHWEQVLRTGNTPPPLWLRVNRRRIDRAGLAARLAEAGIAAQAAPEFPDALRLEHSARITDLPGFAEGLFSVQDAGAQACAGLLELEDGQRVLDACAAPGGKAAHILEYADVELTALELDPERTRRVTDGFDRLGLHGRVVVGDAADPGPWWDRQVYDRILIDAPCSATGVLRRHPEIRWLRRAADVEANASGQRAILDALWPLLAPGGLLVYATCSILHAENREQVESFLGRHEDATALDCAPPESVRCRPGSQILPGSLDRDGFYYAVLRRMQR
jgi:16S rRNA (cytosine967-C5)-methyltransferase